MRHKSKQVDTDGQG